MPSLRTRKTKDSTQGREIKSLESLQDCNTSSINKAEVLNGPVWTAREMSACTTGTPWDTEDPGAEVDNKN